MPPRRLDPTLWGALSAPGKDTRTDADLLARFLGERDERAFEALLLRHAPAVRAACRGWLREPADVDDAAQATFLVLVQRAASIRHRAALGAWLCRVAENVARRLRRQRPTAPLPEGLPGPEPAGPDDLRDLLAEEIARLPEKYRRPVQLCYLAGLTTAEAAGYLGCPRGTVLTRLAWARERLKQRLTRRGVSAGDLAVLLVPAAPAAGGRWVNETARAAAGLLAGRAPAAAGASERAVSLAKGVVRAMKWERVKYGALAVLLALGGLGLGLHHWATASGGPRPAPEGPARAGARPAPPGADEKGPRAPLAAEGKDKAHQAEARPGRRREAVIRLPLGTFVKEVDAAPYGSGRVTWTYEEERVLGLIEVSVMGGELELATEAEYALSSNGAIYGLITSVQLRRLRLPEGKGLDELRPFVGMWSAAEPFVNEVVLDMPFSYRFRAQGDRLVISNFRMLLAGPNPLGKLGGFLAGKEVGAGLAAFQALGAAFEGTYTREDGQERPGPNRRRPPAWPRLGAGAKTK